MIGDIEVSSLKGAMDVRWHFGSFSVHFLTNTHHSCGLTTELEWSTLYHQQLPDSRQLYPVSTIASLVNHIHKHDWTW